jgi:hypothetical protein
MEPTTARPRAPSTKPRTTPAAKGGRPRKVDGAVRDLPGITVRVEPELLARLDASVARRNAGLRAQGASTSRGAVMVIALREFCEREEAAAAEHTSGAAS